MSNADTNADVARGDHEDVPPLSISSQTGRFMKWKRAKRHTSLLHEAGYLLPGLVSLATVTGLFFLAGRDPGMTAELIKSFLRLRARAIRTALYSMPLGAVK